MKRAVATRPSQDTSYSRVLYMVFELGRTEWKLGFTTGLGQTPRERTLRAGDLTAVETEIKSTTDPDARLARRPRGKKPC